MKVIVQQPALPKYRLPLFSKISENSEINLKILYSTDDSLPSFKGEGFSSRVVKNYSLPFLGLMWCPSQLESAKKSRCDVLILPWNIHYLSLLPTLLRARLNGVKVILWGHGYSKRESLVKKTLRDFIGKMATSVLFYDKVTAKRYVDSGWNKERVNVALNTLDTSPVNRAFDYWNNNARLTKFKREHDLLECSTILYVGRLYPENNVEVLFNALAFLKQESLNIKLVIIGKQNNYADELKQLAHDLGIKKSVQFVGEIYEEEELAPYFLSSDLFCYPANIGLSIIHAMAYGLPVLTGDKISAHNPEIHALKNGENGFLFNDNDSLALKDKILEILHNDEHLTSVRKNARLTIEQDYSINRMAEGYIKAIKQTMVS
ncbi:glycosyltransferase family 4 protein [Vibrio sp. 1978]|uniref:glycosyltransferase family 4 protein n=1 Tax=Vibrio sp. 1978 TaxID=3074585 RepID=UPI0029666928|nr:glycosyltransferase family 4 protein [Vibrio sp. 1978]MDW3056448.1 glycosyltransferase family 4 protein [Vibrio sp. 1978]